MDCCRVSEEPVRGQRWTFGINRSGIWAVVDGLVPIGLLLISRGLRRINSSWLVLRRHPFSCRVWWCISKTGTRAEVHSLLSVRLVLGQ